MNKSMISFAVVVKDGVIQQIGRSYITQPAAGKAPKQETKKSFGLNGDKL